MRMHKWTRVIAGGAMVVALGGGAHAATVIAAPSDDERRLKPFRAITAEYRDPARALADGFVATDVCVEVPGLGGMGYHYPHPDRLDGRLELGRPEVLLYGDDEGGRRRLLGVEYVVVDADQDLATDDDRPSLKGHDFQGPMPGHEPGMPVHYDLHVWAWQDNPAGAFEPWNPSVDC